MIARFITGRLAVALAALFALVMATQDARADAAAANDCAARLAKDARAIFDATLPQLKPGTDLRTVVTARARSLAISGAIARDTARQSATEAGTCLRLVGS
jgi:hypothetical protein